MPCYAASGEELLTLKRHSDAVNSVAFRPDGNRLVSASDDNMVKVWYTRPHPQESTPEAKTR